jgi:hypothetical protein
VYIRSYKPGELSKDLALHGRDYIVQRFQDVWGIDRSNEITLDSIHNRRNLIALEGSEVIGWLGVHEDGELVNGCGGPGHSSYSLIMLLKHLFQDSSSQSRQYYAFVPIDYLASAGCCIKAGMHLPDSIPAEFVAKAYGNKVVTLIKLVYNCTNESVIPDARQSQYERLTRLKCIIKEYAKPSKPRQFLKLLVEARKRLTDRLSFLSLHLGIDADLALRQFSLIPKFLLSVPISLLYYILALHILGRDVPTYWNFLAQRKSEQDREELVRYLEISKEALSKMASEVDSNNKEILEYIKENEDEDKFYSASQAKIILEKQEFSIDLLSKIFAGYSSNLQDGIDSGKDSIQKYTIVLYYMSKAPPYNPADFNKLVDKDILRADCNQEDCVVKTLKEYVEGTLTK